MSALCCISTQNDIFSVEEQFALKDPTKECHHHDQFHSLIL